MNKKYIYNCGTCAQKVELNETPNIIPVCCGERMKESESLAPCRMSETAEHARLDSVNEPCNDGRAGTV
jgi:hypothetical protein